MKMNVLWVLTTVNIIVPTLKAHIIVLALKDMNYKTIYEAALKVNFVTYN